MSKNITRKITDYVSVNMTVAGTKYEFTNKDGKVISGITKDAIKIKTPNGTLNLLPSELKALLNLFNDKEVQDEIAVRMN
jgi:hypothetical protein